MNINWWCNVSPAEQNLICHNNVLKTHCVKIAYTSSLKFYACFKSLHYENLYINRLICSWRLHFVSAQQRFRKLWVLIYDSVEIKLDFKLKQLCSLSTWKSTRKALYLDGSASSWWTNEPNPIFVACYSHE